VILSFGNDATKQVWEGFRSKGLPNSIQEIARRKLRMIHNSVDLKDLMIPPSNKLEKLKGTFKDFYSIRINDQWRIIFTWEGGNASLVKIIDYH